MQFFLGMPSELHGTAYKNYAQNAARIIQCVVEEAQE